MTRIDNSKALLTVRVYRRQLLDKVLKAIENDEPKKVTNDPTSWEHIGNIERQCILLEHLVDLVNPSHEA